MEHLPRIQYVAAQRKSQRFIVQIGRNTRKIHRNNLFMSMFNDISCGTRDNEQKCLANARLVSLYARRFGQGQWSLIGLGSKKKWSCISEDSPQGVWDNIAERMLEEFAESGCPIFRATTPLSRGQLNSKGHGKLLIHFAADLETVETIFRISVSAKPAQSLRSSRRGVGRIRIPSRKNGATCCDGTIEFLTRAQCDQERSFFGE